MWEFCAYVPEKQERDLSGLFNHFMTVTVVGPKPIRTRTAAAALWQVLTSKTYIWINIDVIIISKN